MNLLKSLIALSVVTTVSGCVVIAGTPSKADFHQQKTLDIQASDLTALNVEAGAGFLKIKGVEGLDTIQVTADIYTDKKARDDYQLTLVKQGDSAKLVAKNGNTSGIWNGQSPKIDLTVQVPQSMMLDIEDGSGALTIDNIVGDTKIKDGSGGIAINNVKGNLKIDDGSGSINVQDVNGDVQINDGSGSILLEQVAGNAEIEDGSGSLTVKQVTGHVKVDDGSGGIVIDNVGSLTIVESGSGGLSVKNVKAGFEIDS
ncbi:hypothetical protein [Thalassotalea marina]|uniref:DUF4097 domain-containing protein n=1 Tax=Thalassotalea marina TaxID=1673741 RepID=A0A919EHU3_9GAMM|nr:hypothetical protein [Thalassotalea marina]GHF81434.1 hypothetical protein GCM10017161_06080 [Thalassotalea marina]